MRYERSNKYTAAHGPTPTPTDAVCPRGTYGDKGKAAWLRAAPTALLFEQPAQTRS
jgi:hypothetical protein